MVQIHRLPRTPDGASSAVVAALLDVDRAVLLDGYGHDDFCQSATAWAEHVLGSPYRESHVWVALRDGVDPQRCDPADAVGFAMADLPLAEDLHKAEIHVAVRPGERRRGYGWVLYDTMGRLLADRGRTVQQTWTFGSALAADNPAAHLARSGTGAVDGRSAEALWLRRQGFELEQVERLSTLAIPEPTDAFWAELATMRSSAATAAGDGYEVTGWTGRTPPELREPLARLHEAMSTDAPSAGLDVAPQTWDAERVIVWDERSIAKGRDRVTTAIRHRASGALVAFTELDWHRDRPAGVVQETTLVLGSHRGRRLGMLAKTANLARLAQANPEARRVHTWNAAENRHMLAINDALGFVPQGWEGAWQKRVSR